MVQRRTKERPELLLARESVSTLHGDKPLGQRRQRQRDFKCGLITQPAIRFGLVNTNDDHRHYCRAASDEVVRILARTGCRQKERYIKLVRVLESKIQIRLDQIL